MNKIYAKLKLLHIRASVVVAKLLNHLKYLSVSAPGTRSCSCVLFEPRPTEHRCFGVLERHDVNGCRKIALQTGRICITFIRPSRAVRRGCYWLGRRQGEGRGGCGTAREGESSGPLDAHVWLIKVVEIFFPLFLWRSGLRRWPAAPADCDTNKIEEGTWKEASVCTCRRVCEGAWSLNASYYPYLRP